MSEGVAHVFDPGWMFLLIKAIYGGDPSIERIAATLISSAAPYLVPGGKAAGGETEEFAKVQERLKAIGVDIRESAAQARTEALTEPNTINRHRTLCVHFEGRQICITLPTVNTLPRA